MKKILILLTILLTFTTGCRHLFPAQPKPAVQPDKPVELPAEPQEEPALPEEVPEQRISDDGILYFPVGNITLLAYEDEMDLTTVLGPPLVEETIILENADTFNGSHQKTLTYQHTSLTLFSPAQDGQRFYLINIETENESVTTNRGISLGDTLEDLGQAYPEVTRSLDGTTGTDGRYEMVFQEYPYTYLYFYIEESLISKIQVKHEFP